MKPKMKKILIDLLGYTIIIGFFLLVISILATFAGAALTFLGVYYTSYVFLIVFFAVILAVCYPINYLANLLPRMLILKGYAGIKRARLIYVTIDTLSIYAVMRIVDLIMSTVTTNYIGALMLAFIFAILSRDKNKDLLYVTKV